MGTVSPLRRQWGRNTQRFWRHQFAIVHYAGELEKVVPTHFRIGRPGRHDTISGHDRSRLTSGFMTLQRDMNDMIEPIDKHEPIDNSEPADAIEPTERTDPTDATDSTDPFEAIDNTESSDNRDHLELSPARRIHWMLRPQHVGRCAAARHGSCWSQASATQRESKYAPDFAPPESSRVGLPPCASS